PLPSDVSRYVVCLSVDSPLLTEISILSLHDALPICVRDQPRRGDPEGVRRLCPAPVGTAADPTVLGGQHREVLLLRPRGGPHRGDRKSTRLNSIHQITSYAVFCLKKKNVRNTRMHNK